jgi:hypothetical protein
MPDEKSDHILFGIFTRQMPKFIYDIDAIFKGPDKLSADYILDQRIRRATLKTSKNASIRSSPAQPLHRRTAMLVQHPNRCRRREICRRAENGPGLSLRYLLCDGINGTIAL